MDFNKIYRLKGATERPIAQVPWLDGDPRIKVSEPAGDWQPVVGVIVAVKQVGVTPHLTLLSLYTGREYACVIGDLEESEDQP